MFSVSLIQAKKFPKDVLSQQVAFSRVKMLITLCSNSAIGFGDPIWAGEANKQIAMQSYLFCTILPK